MVLALAISLATLPAEAGRCDHLLRKADTAAGPALARAFAELAECDRQVAEDHYVRFMTSSGDVDTLVALSLEAIDHDVWTPVWHQLSKISSYDARDEVAAAIGRECGTHPKIVSFLEGAYFGLRDIEFQQWDDAFLACKDPNLEAWLTGQVEKPPARRFDEKYDALLGIYVDKLGRDALPHLARGAIAAAENGPYDAILMKINAAVQPEFGEEMTEEDRRALQEALLRVAEGVDPERARGVADQLANAGFQEAAARLLPRIYPDRIQPGGHFVYGAASVELGTCKGEKTAVIHYATVEEPGRRWVILSAVEEPMRALKPRLKKCDPDPSPWPVATTPEPLANPKAVKAWVDELAAQWREKGYEVTTRAEKTVVLD